MQAQPAVHPCALSSYRSYLTCPPPPCPSSSSPFLHRTCSYNGALKKVPISSVLRWSMLLGVALGSTQLILITGLNRTWGLSDQLFVLGDSVMLTVLGQVRRRGRAVRAAARAGRRSGLGGYGKVTKGRCCRG